MIFESRFAKAAALVVLSGVGLTLLTFTRLFDFRVEDRLVHAKRDFLNSIYLELLSIRDDQLIAYGPFPTEEDFVPGEMWEGELRYAGAISFIFLTRKGLSIPEIWAWWFQDANRWAAEAFPAEFKTGGAKAVIDLKIHAKHATPGMFPANMREGLIADPGICTWGKTIPCIQRGLRAGLENPEARFFVLVSDSSVPLKTFAEIYTDFARNPRSRFAYMALKRQPFPKHQQWVFFSRPHAEALVASPLGDAPDSYPWPRTLRRGQPGATDDEWRTFAILVAAVGEKQLYKEVNEGCLILMTDEQLKTSQLDAGRMHTFVRFRGHEARRIGEVMKSPPATFASVRRKALDELLAGNDPWFARKFAPNATVVFENDEVESLNSTHWKTVIKGKTEVLRMDNSTNQWTTLAKNGEMTTTSMLGILRIALSDYLRLALRPEEECWRCDDAFELGKTVGNLFVERPRPV